MDFFDFIKSFGGYMRINFSCSIFLHPKGKNIIYINNIFFENQKTK